MTTGLWLEMGRDGLRWLEMIGDGWRWLEMAGDSWRWLEMAGDRWRWLEIAGDIPFRSSLDKISIPLVFLLTALSVYMASGILKMQK